MKKEHDQLLLDFERSSNDLKVAVDNFGKAADALAGSHKNPETGAMVNDEMMETRRAINRLVGVLATQTGMKFHTVWVMAYHELHARIGFHAVAASRGKGTHLDAVEQAGHLSALQETVESMLTSGTG